jgi:F-type H+-transporting ATPase subunit 8
MSKWFCLLIVYQREKVRSFHIFYICLISLYVYFLIIIFMPQLVPFFFVNQVSYNFLLLIILVYLFSKYILPKFVRLFKTRLYLKTLESNKNTIS